MRMRRRCSWPSRRRRRRRRMSSPRSTSTRPSASCSKRRSSSTGREAEMPQRNIVEAINNALADEMESDPRVMVLGLDVGKLGGVFRTTSGLVERFGAERVVDTPLAEASIIGASLGLALAGMVPVAEIQFLGFTAQGFHQLGPQLGKFRQRSRGRYHCQVTIRAPFGGGIRSPEFHSDAIEAQFVQSPW